MSSESPSKAAAAQVLAAHRLLRSARVGGSKYICRCSLKAPEPIEYVSTEQHEAHVADALVQANGTIIAEALRRELAHALRSDRPEGRP